MDYLLVQADKKFNRLSASNNKTCKEHESRRNGSHDELSHLGLHSEPSCLNYQYYTTWRIFFFNFSNVNFVVCSTGTKYKTIP